MAKIRKAIEDGFVTFISGMARGVDIWAAEVVLRLRDEGKPIHLICASPFESFERSWSEDWMRQYNEILRRADIVKFVCKGYSRACFQIRNEWMVDRSALVIAVYNGTLGGMKNTIDYATRVNVRTIKLKSLDNRSARIRKQLCELAIIFESLAILWYNTLQSRCEED